MVKWIHGGCAKHYGLVVSQLKLSHCVLCGQEFDPYDRDEECVLCIERGHLVLEVWEEEYDDSDPFKVKQVGYVHFTCAAFDGWDQPLADLRCA